MEKYMLKQTDKVKRGYVCTKVFTEDDYKQYLADGYQEVTQNEALEKAGQKNITSKYLGVTVTNK